MKCKSGVTLGFAACFALALTGCSSSHQPAPEQSQDQQTREKVAEATQKAKQATKVVVHKADQAAKALEHKAEIVKQGVKEGWNGDASQRVNLNSASEADLQSLPGISQQDAQNIIHGRPYTRKSQLVDKKLVSKEEFQKIESRITVK